MPSSSSTRDQDTTTNGRMVETTTKKATIERSLADGMKLTGQLFQKENIIRAMQFTGLLGGENDDDEDDYRGGKQGERSLS